MISALVDLGSKVKRAIRKPTSFLLARIRREHVERAIVCLARLKSIDLLDLAHRKMGIMNYENDVISGERLLISDILARYLDSDSSVLFDVGAHTGQYSQKLRLAFPTACLYAFEPNPQTFAVLASALVPLDVHCFAMGLGASSGDRVLYDYIGRATSQHASVYQDVLLNLHKAQETTQFGFRMTTLDEFCQSYHLDCIDFIKIDVEGSELEVIKGAQRMIAEKRIRIIQFEFNEMNTVARVFLKDFFDRLDGFRLYRLDTHRLLPVAYSPKNEIFRFQNFVAIREDLPQPC